MCVCNYDTMQPDNNLPGDEEQTFCSSWRKDLCCLKVQQEHTGVLFLIAIP